MESLRFEAAAKACAFHKGQTYNEGSYFLEHIVPVASTIEKMGGSDAAIVVGYLHDILEDTPCTEEELRRSFPDEIVDAVVLVTKLEGVDYKLPANNSKYLSEIRKNPLAKLAKMADTVCNLKASIAAGNMKRMVKYSRQLSYLIEGEQRV